MRTPVIPLEAPALTLNDLQEIRRNNLRRLAARESASKLAKRLGYRSPSFLSQMIGPNPTREVTEKNARRFEGDLGLEPGALDVPEHAPASPTPQVSVEMVASVIRAVGSICAAENVNLGPDKFSEVVALAFADTIDRGEVPSERIRSVVRLLK